MPESIVSVAVAVGDGQTLQKIDRSLPLSEIVAELCTKHSLPDNPDHYALQIARPSPRADNQSIANRYVTDSLISQVVDGTELRLVYSATTTVRMLLEPLAEEPGPKRHMVFLRLAKACEDPEFARCFVQEGGATLVIDKLRVSSAKETSSALTCLRLSMQHGYLDGIGHVGLDTVVAEIAGPGESEALREALLTGCFILGAEQEEAADRLRAALTTTETLVLVKGRTAGVQLAVLGMVNALLLSSDIERRSADLRALAADPYRQIIFRHVLGSGQRTVPDDLAHQLHVFQTILLNFLLGESQETIIGDDPEATTSPRVNSSWSRISTDANLDSLKFVPETPELRRDSSVQTLDEEDVSEDYMPSTPLPSPKQPATMRRYFSKISDSNDAMVNRLARNCLGYFSKRYRDSYVLVKEEAGLVSDLDNLAKDVVEVICSVVRVGSSHGPTSTNFSPIFFAAREPFFEELFCHSQWTLGRTVQELKARKVQDHELALRILHLQLEEALAARPTNLSALVEKLKDITAVKVQDAWFAEQRANFEQLLAKHPAIVDLRNEIKRKAEKLVVVQRLKALKAGHKFPKQFETLKAQKAKNWWFANLSEDERVIIYEDCKSDDQTYSNRHQRLSIATATGLATGKRCPHAKGRKYVEDGTMFSLLHEGGSLDFIAPTKEIYNLWIDGLTWLLGRPVESSAFQEDVEMIVDMEVRLRLLELGDVPIPIPKAAPLIPPPPENYDFCDESSA